jgi:methyl-accepting chemotaxis protein
VLTASTTVAEQATRMGEEVKKFFLALRTGPMDRRKGRDENYTGAERRAARADRAA